METVPVTLGAAPPGTTGASPLFGNAVGANENAGPAIGTFLQELQNIVAESYGAVKAANKTVQPAKQNEKLHDEGKDKNPASPITVPVPLPTLLPVTVPDSQPASNIVNTNMDPALAQTVKAETKFQMPGVSAIAAASLNTEKSVPLPEPVSRAASSGNKRAQEHAQIQEHVASQPITPLIADEQAETPDRAVPLPVSAVSAPGVEQAVSMTAHRPKDLHFADVQRKTGDDHPSPPLAARISEIPVLNNLGVAATPTLPSEKHQDGARKIPSVGKQPNFQLDSAAPVSVGVKPEVKISAAGVAQSKLQTPPVQSIQAQDTASTTEPARPEEKTQFLKLEVEETLQSHIDTHVAVAHLQENIQAKKVDFQRADSEFPGLHKPFAPGTKPRDTKPLINDQPLSRDIQLEIKTEHAEAKPGESLQKANTSTNAHDDVVAAIAAPILAQTQSVNNDNGVINAQQQITLVPNAHVVPSSPSLMGKAEAPTAAPADSPALPLPSEKIQVVRLVDRLGQAEMHLGMRTETFGSVQVHTVIRDSQVGLTIGSERGDLKTYLAAEVSGLESNLRQHDLHFADVRFVASSFSPGGNQYRGADSQPQSFQQGRSFPHAQATFVLRPGSANEIEIVNDQAVGLSVHA